MCHDHSAHGICVDQASVEDEGYEMVIQDYRLKVKVRGDIGCSDEERSKSIYWLCRGLFSFTLYFHHVQDATKCQHGLKEASRSKCLCTVFATSTTPP